MLLVQLNKSKLVNSNFDIKSNIVGSTKPVTTIIDLSPSLSNNI